MLQAGAAGTPAGYDPAAVAARTTDLALETRALGMLLPLLVNREA